MVNDKTNPEKNTIVNTVIDITQKLTVDDINKIEKYRQTRKTSLLTVMFTDIVGYTGFTYQAGEIVSGKFRHIHDELIISQIKKDGHGEIIKQIGDSFLIIFSDPTLAVKQALKLQELFSLNSENLTFKGYQLKIRIGLHMGQVSVEDHIVPDVFGTHVNLASRVMSLAKGGQVLVSGSVWDNASGWLKDEQELKIDSVYYGKIKLKGIGKATEIYEFYYREINKSGIPKLMLKRKQKYQSILAVSIVLLLFVITMLLYFYFLKPVQQVSEAIYSNRGKMVLANIDSYDSDIQFSVDFCDFTGNNFKLKENNAYLIEPVNPEILNNIDDDYQQYMKTNFLSDFDLETETDIKREYAKKGLTVPANFREDTIIYRARHAINDTSKLYSLITRCAV